MTALLSRDGMNFSLACDSCGLLVADVAGTAPDWNAAWVAFSGRGWRGEHLPTGPHACERCELAPTPAGTAGHPAGPSPDTRPGRAPHRTSVDDLRDATVVRLTGNLRLAANARLHEILRTAVHPRRHVLIDLTHVRTVDSGTFGALVQAHHRAADHGARVCTFGAGGSVLHAFRLLSLDQLLPLFADRASALAWIRDPHRREPARTVAGA